MSFEANHLSHPRKTAKNSTGRTRAEGLQVLRDMYNLTSAAIRPFGSGPPNSISHLGYGGAVPVPQGSRPRTSKVSLDAEIAEGMISTTLRHSGGHGQNIGDHTTPRPTSILPPDAIA
jgi:hypothetical protein